jgi:hypothetical protein
VKDEPAKPEPFPPLPANYDPTAWRCGCGTANWGRDDFCRICRRLKFRRGG